MEGEGIVGGLRKSKEGFDGAVEVQVFNRYPSCPLAAFGITWPLRARPSAIAAHV